MAVTTLTPTLLWAQTKDDLYLTVELSKPSDVKVDLTDDSFKFHATKEGKVYEFNFKFFKPVKSSDYKTKDERFLEFKVPKSEPESWTTLNSCGKKHYIKCNWDKWVDSDAEADDLGDGFDMPNFGDFGDFDMNGMGGDMDDEEDLDDLDETDNEEVEGTNQEKKNEEPRKQKSADCKNPNCSCDPCECTGERQCLNSSNDSVSCSLPKDQCCGKAKCHPEGVEQTCCSTKNCSEQCPC